MLTLSPILYGRFGMNNCSWSPNVFIFPIFPFGSKHGLELFLALFVGVISYSANQLRCWVGSRRYKIFQFIGWSYHIIRETIHRDTIIHYAVPSSPTIRKYFES